MDFRNGDFSSGLENWARRYVYMEDQDPSNLCEVREAPGNPAGNSLYLFCRRRGYQAPGQDRLPQDINRISQAVEIMKGKAPIIKFRYRIDGDASDPGRYSGGYAWIEGYAGSKKVFNMIYSAGMIWVNIGGKYSQIREYTYIQMALSEKTDVWHHTTLNIAEDYDRADRGTKFTELGVDRLVLNLGVWNINDGDLQPFGIYYTDLSISQVPGPSSNIDGVAIVTKPKEKEWWRNKIWPSVNIAGEQRYIIATQEEQTD